MSAQRGGRGEPGSSHVGKWRAAQQPWRSRIWHVRGTAQQGGHGANRGHERGAEKASGTPCQQPQSSDGANTSSSLHSLHPRGEDGS